MVMRTKFKRSPQNKREQERCFNLMNKGRDLISMTQGWDWGGMNNSLIQFFRDPSWKMFRTPINRRRDLLKPWQSAMLLSCILILLITGLFFLMSFWKFNATPPQYTRTQPQHNCTAAPSWWQWAGPRHNTRFGAAYTLQTILPQSSPVTTYSHVSLKLYAFPLSILSYYRA